MPGHRNKSVTDGLRVLSVKRSVYGKTERYKARHFFMTLTTPSVAPTDPPAAVMPLFVLGTHYELSVRHVGIQCVFLNRDMDEEVHTKQPTRCGTGDKRLVWRL